MPMNQPQRVILHVFPSQSWGGAEIYSLALAKQQQNEGEKLWFWVAPGSRMADEAQKLGLRLVTESLKERMDFGFSRIKKVIRSTGTTHVHLHWTGGMWSLGLAKSGMNFKLILHMHMWMKHTKKDPLHRILYKNIDVLVVAGAKAREAALACLPVTREQVQICPYAVEMAYADPVPREKLGFEASDFVFGIFSRLDRQKGILEFLKALAPSIKEEPDVRAVIVGDPTHEEADSMLYEKELKGFALEHFKAGVIQFQGFKTNFRDWLATCSVLALPSYHESYSIMILEAFALGIPVFSTHAGGTPDLVDSQRGWLVEPQNIESLREGLKQVFREKHQIFAKGLLAQEYVKAYHSFPNVLKRFNEIYDSL